MQCHASTFTNPAPPSEWRCLKTASRARRAGEDGRGERRAGSKWLTGSLLANFPSPIHATSLISFHESCAPKREQPPGARRAARDRTAGQGGRGPACSKWLTGYLLANFPAPIHATPCINLHESRALKRVALPGACQPGRRGRRRATGSRQFQGSENA